MIWSSYYSVGISGIDEEHKELINMISKLQHSLVDGLVTRQMGLVIMELVNYTKHHFASEERLMKQINYPEFDSHKLLHEELIKEVIKILKYLKEGKMMTSVDLIDFLKKWLNDHIVNEDKKIGAYYNEFVQKMQTD